jgi:hypothetical protein
MFFWYIAGSVFLVWNVFQSGGLDVRAIALGGIAPLLVDLPFREQRYGHTLLIAVVVLLAVMLATAGRGHRLLRRHLIGIPIGWFCGLALSGAFLHQHTFWWPAFGNTFEGAPLIPWPGAIALELLGLLALWWCWVRFGLRDPARRRVLWRTGRVAVVEHA